MLTLFPFNCLIMLGIKSASATSSRVLHLATFPAPTVRVITRTYSYRYPSLTL